MPHVPPVVTYRVTGGAAYLIAWQQHPDRTWWARILWLECEGEAFRGTEARVDARDVIRICGQDYSKVPRRQLNPRIPRTPQDSTDPRDPGRTSRAQDRARLDRQRRRAPDPDF